MKVIQDVTVKKDEIVCIIDDINTAGLVTVKTINDIVGFVPLFVS
jgi:hypothetical protein